MVEEKFSQKIRLKKINETRKYSLEEIEQNELLSKKHKRVCRALRYIENSLFLVSLITGCISISAFAALVCILCELRVLQ